MPKQATLFIPIFLLIAGAHLHAEDSGERAIVPLHDATRPASIRAHMMNGGITVRGEDRKDVAVETSTRSRDENRERRSQRSDGMRRLELPGSNGLDITEENNVVTIKTDSFNRGGDLVILVPLHSSLQLKCMNGGDIAVENVEGEIEAENLNGAISLKDVSGSVVAHSLNGAVSALISRVDPSKPMSFSTMNGAIDVTLPDSVRANVSMKTDNGEILSDFDIKLDSRTRSTPGENGRQPDGTYHLRFDRTLHGSINGGGPEYQFRSFNGQIFIRRRK